MEPCVTVKEKIHQIVDSQPDDSSFCEILKELTFAQMVERGVKDLDEGRTISHEELKKKAAIWGK